MQPINDFDSDDAIRQQETKGTLSLYYLNVIREEYVNWMIIFDKLYTGKRFKNVDIERYIQENSFLAAQLVRKIYIGDLYQTGGQLDPTERTWSILWKTTQCKSTLKIGHYGINGGVMAPIIINLETKNTAYIEQMRSSDYDVKDETKTTLLLVAAQFLHAIGIDTIRFTTNTDKLSNVYLSFKGKTYRIKKEKGIVYISYVGSRQLDISDDDTLMRNPVTRQIIKEIKKLRENQDK